MATIKDEGTVERSSHASMRERELDPDPLRPPLPEAVNQLLHAYGLPEDDDTRAQLAIFMNAMSVMVERRGQYMDAWREYGALNNLIRAATKVKRLVNLFWHNEGGPPYEDRSDDDAIDALNYLAFFLRQSCLREWKGKSDG